MRWAQGACGVEGVGAGDDIAVSGGVEAGESTAERTGQGPRVRDRESG